ncbi:hypothetical protein B7R21_19065 [Subtercola boreus]|uniref:Restriction endonuclease n=1 Tax=Subtercola boreus TaxID=120213 RepID=A0A3E0VAL8_9MICO|nr:hypothetical protein [Subtercola boreus]RFA06665.1 hypothetical protein B7R21_19065 [Subtercola boreus]
MADDLAFVENVPRGVSNRYRGELIAASEVLKRDLAPRLGQLALGDGSATFRNLVGSFRLTSGDVVEVSPKVGSDGNWSDSVVQLLEPTTRISVTGSRRSRSSPRPHDLTAALALEFARRLERALRQSGPIEVYERRHFSTRRPNGRLNISKWVRGAILDPSLFPVSRDELSSSNDFTRGLSVVAGQLSRSAVSADLSSRLRRLQTAVIPGHPVPTHVSPTVAQRVLPAQWAKYRPAWDLAAALLRNHSVVGDPGRSIGLEVAIEPWPLLETLLGRALAALSGVGPLSVIPKSTHPLLLLTNGSTATNVIPDGALQQENGQVVATFECKYTVPRRTPKDSHVYQALTTAAALGAPLAVLIYPTDEPPTNYTVSYQGQPATLVTAGLSLFSYQKGSGDLARAATIQNILQHHQYSIASP